jgi:hypothetical protein
MSKCRDDLISITRYVTWNLDERSSGALSRALPDHTDMVGVYKVAMRKDAAPDKIEDNGKPYAGIVTETGGNKALTPMENEKQRDRDYRNLIQLVEEAMMSRDSNRTNIVVSGMVQHIVASWQHQFCKDVITKYNCYFLLPFVDRFHKFIRHELQGIYQDDGDGLSDVFDIGAARRSLQLYREELASECMMNKKLQEKFDVCSKMMRKKSDGADPAFAQKRSISREKELLGEEI